MLPDVNQIFRFSTDFRKSHQYQISRKSFQWEPFRYTRTADRQTDRHDEANRRFSLFMREHLKLTKNSIHKLGYVVAILAHFYKMD